MLEPPDTHYVSAAAGWLGLGNPAEAEIELRQLSPSAAVNPDVLELRWLVCAEQTKWDAGLKVAQKLLEVAPERPTGWLHRAYALRRVPDGSLREAWEALLPAAQKFPGEMIIAYNLACYACQMCELSTAREWLARAIERGSLEEVRRMALADEDLIPLWEEIEKMT